VASFKYDRYLMRSPGGDWEKWKLPKWLPIEVVCEYHPNWLVFIWVEHAKQAGPFVGATWAMWSAMHEAYVAATPDPTRMPAHELKQLIAIVKDREPDPETVRRKA